MADSTSYERRNARARALGYKSYYDFRTRGQSGARPPDAAPLEGYELRLARGHASRADLVASIKPGTLVVASPDEESRRKDGSYSRIQITTIDADGKERNFLLRGSSARNLKQLVAQIEAAGGILSPSYPLDEFAPTEEPA